MAGFFVEAEPQMKRGRLPAAKQLHQMAEITVTTGVKSSLEISVIILLPSYACCVNTDISSGVAGINVKQIVNTKRTAIWVADIATGFEPDTPRNFFTDR